MPSWVQFPDRVGFHLNDLNKLEMRLVNRVDLGLINAVAAKGKLRTD